MSRQKVGFDYGLNKMLAKLAHPGLLLASTRATGESNAMTIGWGSIGIMWGLPIYTVLVRPSRYTYELIEDSGEFTVNVPSEDMRRWVMVCGTKSGRDVDKIGGYDVAVSPGNDVQTITIDESPLVYECRVVHHNDVIPAQLAPEIDVSAYSSGDYHRLYYGQILGTYADPSW